MIELQRNLYVLRRWWWLLVAAAVLGALVAYALTKTLLHQQYLATATVAMGQTPSSPNGVWITSLSASADAELVASLPAARAAVQALPLAQRRKVRPQDLSSSIAGSSSSDNQLLFVQVQWPDYGVVEQLANAVANAFVQQERQRLEQKYTLIHSGFTQEEAHLGSLLQSVPNSGSAGSWLRARYADAASRLYQEDADARIEASSQEASLQVALPAASITKSGPKTGVNTALGAILAFLLALVFAYVATTSYGEEAEADWSTASSTRSAMY